MNMKSIVIVAMLLLSMMAFIPIHPALSNGTTVSLSPASITTDPPVSFTVDINVADVTDLRAWDIQIRWNPQIISFVSIAEGPFLSDTGATELLYNVYIGYILSAACTIEGAGGSSGTGRLATVTFACYDTGDAFNITVESSTLLDSDNVEIDHIASGAKVQTQSPVVKSSRKVTTNITGQTYNDQDPAPGDTVRFDARESYAQAKLVGDVDRSGRTDLGDSNLIGTNWFKTEGTGMLWDADIDRSGRVDLADSNLVGANWFKVGGKIANFTWNFGDGTAIVFGKDKSVVTHVFADYSDADGYTVTLTVKDGVGKEWFKTKQVKIWRDIAAVDIWPCYDDYLGMDSVMPGDILIPGTIIFPTGAFRNMGTLKQTWVVTIFVMNTVTRVNTTLFTRIRADKPPTTKADLWYPPTATGMGFEVNDPNMTAPISFDVKFRFVDYDADGFYTVGGTERPIWDTDGNNIASAGDIDVTAGTVITGSDPDDGAALELDTQLGWVDSNINGVYNIGERAYYDTDSSGTVTAGDFYVWLESFYYGVVYDVEIHSHPIGASYQFVITVTVTGPAVDLDPTNNEFVYTPIFSDP